MAPFGLVVGMDSGVIKIRVGKISPISMRKVKWWAVSSAACASFDTGSGEQYGSKGLEKSLICLILM